MILGYDWIQDTTEKIVVGPPSGLKFQSVITEIHSKTEEFTDVVREAAYVGVINVFAEYL